MSYMIIFAIVFAVFGAAVWVIERRKGDRLAGPWALLAIPGVYIASVAS